METVPLQTENKIAEGSAMYHELAEYKKDTGKLLYSNWYIHFLSDDSVASGTKKNKTRRTGYARYTPIRRVAKEVRLKPPYRRSQ